MGFKSLRECVEFLEAKGELLVINDEVDPYLEMAAIHLRVFENGGPAIYFKNIKGSEFPAVSNLFGTLQRAKLLFNDSLENVQDLIKAKNDPLALIKKPLKGARLAKAAINALPKKVSASVAGFKETTIARLPLITNWPLDGGAFITMPQVLTHNLHKKGLMHTNMGMYRIQLSGNEYVMNEEVGLHYQLHRGIGIHQHIAKEAGTPLKISVFIGGPPAHAVAAVMPLPEDISELNFAGVLGNRRFRYFYDKGGFLISADADFVITGTVEHDALKPEGPFGDHLGYYSLKHLFPVLSVKKVYYKPDAIWNFTVVGRPPQEDTAFGALIHEITGSAISNEVPGVSEIHAVDSAGVHPLLFAIGSEKYTPYTELTQPQELLTQANRILGTNQLSLAKYLFIANKYDNCPPTKDIKGFLTHILRRCDFKRDLHFQTNTTIDTLDYTGHGLNKGSKVVVAAVGKPIRVLSTAGNLGVRKGCKVVMDGVIAVDKMEVAELKKFLLDHSDDGLALAVLVDDADFAAKNVDNFLWDTFTKSNPASDIYGVGEFINDKHWGCTGTLIIDARIKPHHAPPLIMDGRVNSRVDELAAKYPVLNEKRGLE